MSVVWFGCVYTVSPLTVGPFLSKVKKLRPPNYSSLVTWFVYRYITRYSLCLDTRLIHVQIGSGHFLVSAVIVPWNRTPET